MEPITIVTVVPEGDGFRLDHPAEDLWIAYEVVRRHVDADGVRHYAQLTGAKMTSEGYEFTFDTGDVFSCSSATDYPTSDTVSDESGGGSGGAMIVHEVEASRELLTGTLPNVDGYAWRTETESGKPVYYVDVEAELDDVDVNSLQVVIGNKHFNNNSMERLAYADGVLSIKVGWTGNSYGLDVITRESDADGKTIMVLFVEASLNKTWNEINSADVTVIVHDGTYPDGETFHGRDFVISTNYNHKYDSYSVLTVGNDGGKAYTTFDPDGYPVEMQ